MKTDYIEFKKQRDLGETLTDTFAFLRTQFKPFFTTYFKIVGPFLLVMIVALAIYTYYGGSAYSNIITEDMNSGVSNLAITAGVSLLYLLSFVVTYTLSQATILYYIKSYDEGKGETNFETIRSNVYSRFWSFIGLGILVGLSVGFGLVFCLIPGIYLWVPLSISFSILVFTKKDVSDAYSYSFNLIKDEWWSTFATLLVVFIIATIASAAFSIPAVIYNYAKMGVLSGEIDIENIGSTFNDPVYIVFNVINNLAQFLINLISVIAGAFIYFNLNERKNFTGTFEQIENLGKTPEN